MKTHVGEAFRPPATAEQGADRVGEAFRPPATVPSRERTMSQKTELPPWLPTRRPNRLPLDAYREPGQFFLTIATEGRKPWFRQAEIATHCAQELRSTCLRCGFGLLAYRFMPDHVHILVETDTANHLIGLVHEFKQRSGWWFRHRYQAGGLKASPTSSAARPRPWQKSYYDHVLRGEEDTDAVIRYILENPVDAGLVSNRDEFPYSWSANAP